MLACPRNIGLLTLGLMALTLAACSQQDAQTDGPAPSESLPDILVTSNAFSGGDSIPKLHTCDGADVSPTLSWNGVPTGAQSLALIMDDPDAPGGTWVHWVVYGLPSDLGSLAHDAYPTSAVGGSNDFGDTGYGDPCPPSGPAHRYFFKLYVLDSIIDLEQGATKSQLLEAMNGHILAQGTLMGTYQR